MQEACTSPIWKDIWPQCILLTVNTLHFRYNETRFWSFLIKRGDFFFKNNSHYLNQCWNIVNWTLRNKLQWNFNRNYNIFIKENALRGVVCEMAVMLSRPQCVKLRAAILKSYFPLNAPTNIMDELQKNVIKIHNFSFTIMHLSISSAEWRTLCPGGDALSAAKGVELTTKYSRGFVFRLVWWWYSAVHCG